MKTQVIMMPQEVRMRGFKALKKELGIVGALKFIHQYERGTGNYSKERHAIADDLDLEAIKRLMHDQGLDP